jgi:GntR family transcriptional regulator
MAEPPRNHSLHRRVYDELASRIADGRLARGSQLAPERDLCREFAVSRVTLRRALASLAAIGLVEAVQGRGTFVTAPRLAEPPNVLLSFSRLAESGGLEATASVLSAESRPATIEEGERFRIAPGSQLFELERRRELDGLPVAVTRSLVPLACASDLAEADWTTASLYAELTAAGSEPFRSNYSVEAQEADERTARLLELRAGAPVLVADSSSYTLDDRLVEQGHMVYRGDRYRFRATLTAPWARSSPESQGPGPGRSDADAAGESD